MLDGIISLYLSRFRFLFLVLLCNVLILGTLIPIPFESRFLDIFLLFLLFTLAVAGLDFDVLGMVDLDDLDLDNLPFNEILLLCLCRNRVDLDFDLDLDLLLFDE